MRVSALKPLSFARKPKMASTNPVQFMQQVRAEVAKVSWPSRREVMLTTVMVFIMAALTATFFSLVDIAIRYGLTAIVGGF
jgi:preprotein translocase subunit SecE